MGEIEYLEPPLLKEILEQQRLILEIQKALVEALLHLDSQTPVMEHLS